jgi:hypothetical protein
MADLKYEKPLVREIEESRYLLASDAAVDIAGVAASIAAEIERTWGGSPRARGRADAQLRGLIRKVDQLLMRWAGMKRALMASYEEAALDDKHVCSDCGCFIINEQDHAFDCKALKCETSGD